jgi:hypothetical protein
VADNESEIATNKAIDHFNLVENRRLRLEIAEHRLWKSLRNPGVDISQYAKAAEEIMERFDAAREDAIAMGLLPEEE